MSETKPPPVAPVEGHLYLLFTEYENTTNIRKWSQEPFDDAVEYVRKSDLADLIAACDLALNWADANARWFDISTAPRDGTLVIFYVPSRTNPLIGRADDYWAGAYWLADVTHWTPLPPPPSNPPLPEPLEALGAVLRKIKGA